jgi:hypothetical protein
MPIFFARKPGFSKLGIVQNLRIDLLCDRKVSILFIFQLSGKRAIETSYSARVTSREQNYKSRELLKLSYIKDLTRGCSGDRLRLRIYYYSHHIFSYFFLCVLLFVDRLSYFLHEKTFNLRYLFIFFLIVISQIRD